MFDELAEHQRQIAERLADQSVLAKWLLRLDRVLRAEECYAWDGDRLRLREFDAGG
jgi:hypothetical protein